VARKPKAVRAWALLNTRTGKVECDSFKLPIFWLRKFAIARAQEYYGMALRDRHWAEVEIRPVSGKRGKRK